MRLVYHPSAEDDLAQAFVYYEEQLEGLGEEYLHAIEVALDRLLSFPESGAPIQEDLRQKVIKRFPYSLLYKVEGNVLTLIAVAHHRRDPEFWRERL